MKQIIFTYCEGNDTKIAVVQKEKDKIKILRVASFDVVAPAYNLEEDMEGLKLDGDDLKIEGMKSDIMADKNANVSSISLINSSLKGLNLAKSLFIPVLTDPAVHYHFFEGTKKTKTGNFTQEILDDIQQSKNVTIDQENLEYVELADKAWMAVFLSGEISCIKLINALANYNGKRNYKIQSVKSAEISLSYYVAKAKKFFPDDYSLIVYIGKEYSKLIFLHGRKLKHIGSTLDIGRINLHTYDVYFSKILLEMENGGISSLDNIIVCGEDDSENIILSFYGTFPEANVSKMDFSDFDLLDLKAETKETLSAFTVPLAAAVDYFDEDAELQKGINLLPRYVKEDQKFIQFGWHGYAMLPILFIATFFLTQQYLRNQKKLNEINDQITIEQVMAKQNQDILSKINDIQGRINNFGATQAILDSVSAGTEVWSNSINKIAEFFAQRKNIWLTKMNFGEGDKVNLEGYALSKDVLTDFAYMLKSAELKGVFYETLRDKNSYRFTMNFNLSSYQKDTE
jgi:Tfp pilus assembly protein PilN